MWCAFYDLLIRAHAIVSRFQLTIISHDVSLSIVSHVLDNFIH